MRPNRPSGAVAFEPVPLAAGLAAFLPGLVAIFLLYAPFDGYFKDNVIFLWFIGGLLVGVPLALLDAWVLFASPLVFVVGAPFVEQGAKLVFLNRRKWQGERQAVWNGGAMGAGLASLLALLAAYQAFALEFGWAAIAYVLALSTGVAFVHVATGLALGAGVLDRRPFRAYGIAALGSLPASLLLFAQATAPDPLFALALAAYGVVALVAARRWWIPQGVGPEELRKIRRAFRKST